MSVQFSSTTIFSSLLFAFLSSSPGLEVEQRGLNGQQVRLTNRTRTGKKMSEPRSTGSGCIALETKDSGSYYLQYCTEYCTVNQSAGILGGVTRAQGEMRAVKGGVHTSYVGSTTTRESDVCTVDTVRRYSRRPLLVCMYVQSDVF